MSDKKNIKLAAIIASLKTGEEKLSIDNQVLSYSLLDFWRWSASDILSNAMRGRFAEFIVGSAIDLDIQQLRHEWAAYDLRSKEGIEIEVKSSAYLQSWQQVKYSNISFSIKSSKAWEADKGLRCEESKRQAHIYIFCLLHHKVQESIDPMKLEQWSFYVVPTYKLAEKQASISLKPLQKLAEKVGYNELKAAIEKSYEAQMNFLKNKREISN